MWCHYHAQVVGSLRCMVAANGLYWDQEQLTSWQNLNIKPDTMFKIKDYVFLLNWINETTLGKHIKLNPIQAYKNMILTIAKHCISTKYKILMVGNIIIE